MKKNSYGLRQQWFAHFLFLVLLPPFVHICATVVFGLEAEGSWVMLSSAIMAAVATGVLLTNSKYNWVAASLSGAWPAVLATSRHWYWALDMPSPGGAAQSLVGLLGWTDAPAAVATAIVLIPCGAGGWLFKRYNPE